MKQLSRDLQSIRQFVEGELPPQEFAQYLYDSRSIDDTLGGHQCRNNPAYVGLSLGTFLLQLDLDDPGDALSAQSALSEFLSRKGVPHTPTGRYSDLFDTILESQPPWLDVDSKWVESHLISEFRGSGEKDLKSWLRKEFKKRFRFLSRPPSWLQSPDWPIRNGSPMVFLGELEVTGYFHDQAKAYLFHDPQEGVCETIIQVV